MIELYISTNVKIDMRDMLQILADQKIRCQATENYSSCPHDGKMKVEKGYYFKIFDLSPIDFRDKVWNVLRERLNLTCAYVKYNSEYMGCVLNWPKVFRESVCSNQT